MIDVGIRNTNNKAVSLAHIGKFEILRATKNDDNVFAKMTSLPPLWEFSRLEKRPGQIATDEVAEIKRFGFGKSNAGNRYFVWGSFLFVWNSKAYPILRTPEEYKKLAGVADPVFSESGKEILASTPVSTREIVT
jgi:hypothetical protein